MLKPFFPKEQGGRSVRFWILGAAGPLILAVFLAFGAGETAAQEAGARPGIHIENAWIQAPPIPGRPASGYLDINNVTASSDRLLEIESPMARRIEIHRVTRSGAVVGMKKIEGLDIPARSKVRIEPGVVHLMLFGLPGDLAAGDKVKLRLRFRDAGWLEVEAEVRPFGKFRRP
ncbi:MAG: copper chaperone PCu(A)C [Sphingomonadales bacterium]